MPEYGEQNNGRNLKMSDEPVMVPPPTAMWY